MNVFCVSGVSIFFISEFYSEFINGCYLMTIPPNVKLQFDFSGLFVVRETLRVIGPVAFGPCALGS